MNKKTVIIIVAVIVVVGGVYYGYNRWRQQQLANQILKQMYGINTGGGGILDKLAGGGGNISGQMAQEIAKEAAKEEAKQKADEAKEAARTPEDRYNETKEVAAYDANSKAAVSAAKEIIEKAFGKAKLTSVASNAYDQSGSYSIMEFKIARLTTGDDLAALNKAVTDKGLPVVQSGVSDNTASLSAGANETAVYSFGFTIGGQDIGVDIIKAAQQ